MNETTPTTRINEIISKAAKCPRTMLLSIEAKHPITQEELVQAYHLLPKDKQKQLASHFCVLAAALQLHPFLQQIHLPPHYIKNVLIEISRYPKKLKATALNIGETLESTPLLTQKEALNELAILLVKLKNSPEKGKALQFYQRIQLQHPESIEINEERKQHLKQAMLVSTYTIIAVAATILLLANPVFCAIAGAIALGLFIYTFKQFGEAIQKKRPNQAALDLHHAIATGFDQATKKQPSIFTSQVIHAQENYEKAVEEVTTDSCEPTYSRDRAATV